MNAKEANARSPVKERPRAVSLALNVYAKMVTSVDKGAARDISKLD